MHCRQVVLKDGQCSSVCGMAVVPSLSSEPRRRAPTNAVPHEQAQLPRAPLLDHMKRELQKWGRVRNFLMAPPAPNKPSGAHVAPRTQQQAPPPSTLADAVDRAKQGFKAWSESVYHEHSYFVPRTQIEGTLPTGLRGTLIRNGPALFSGSTGEVHPLEGDGMVYSIAFDGEGGVHFQNKFVRTKAFVEELTAGVQKHRQVFTRKLPHNEHTLHLDLPLVGQVQMISPFNTEFRDSANVNVVHWAGRTVALYEHGLPHVLSNDLRTLGTLNLQDGTPVGPMGPHVRVFTEGDGSKRLMMFVVDDIGIKDAVATFYEFDEGFKLVAKTRQLLPGGAFGQYHDMAITDNFYCLVQNRVHVDFTKLVFQSSFGQASLAECLVQDRELPVKVHLIPRPGKAGTATGLRTFTVPGHSFFTFHAVNAFEVHTDGSSPDPGRQEVGHSLVLDLLSAKKFSYANVDSFVSEAHYGDIEYRSEPHRLVINLRAPPGKPAITRHRFLERFTEMPSINPSKVGHPHHHMYTFASVLEGGSFFGNNQAILKISVDPMNGVSKPLDRAGVKQALWCTASQHHFVGEPIYVPNSSENATGAEDDGYLLVMVFDAEQRQPQLVVLDAQKLQDGPVATIKLAHHLCLGLHGMWTPQYLGAAKGTPNQEPHDIRRGI